jgi:hypothetical protein
MKKKSLMIFGFLWAASGCTLAGFRHYDPIGNCIPAVDDKVFKCTNAQGQTFVVPFSDEKVKKMVCFDKPEWVTHEEACRSR